MNSLNIFTGSGVMNKFVYEGFDQTILKSEILLSKFWSISGGWGKLLIPNFA